MLLIISMKTNLIVPKGIRLRSNEKEVITGDFISHIDIVALKVFSHKSR